MRINFEEVKIKATYYWYENGRRRQKTQTFSQTINPWNKTADGVQKSRAEILEELKDRRADWVLEMRAAHLSEKG